MVNFGPQTKKLGAHADPPKLHFSALRWALPHISSFFSLMTQSARPRRSRDVCLGLQVIVRPLVLSSYGSEFTTGRVGVQGM